MNEIKLWNTAPLSVIPARVHCLARKESRIPAATREGDKPSMHFAHHLCRELQTQDTSC
jgi:hypothetical protein